MLNIKNILKQTKIINKIRKFFNEKNILAVETPLLYDFPSTDPYIDPLTVIFNNKIMYLQSSPEHCMKILLAKGSGSIYQISKAFRNDPQTKLHNYEFTMLEFYILNFDEKDLMLEITNLIKYLYSNIKFNYFSYKDLFQLILKINPYNISINKCSNFVKNNINSNIILSSKQEYLDLIFSYLIQPEIKKMNTVVFVYDYPKEMAALSKVMYNNYGEIVAKRFEIFYLGIELGNGYYELNNMNKTCARFKKDLKTRKTINKPIIPIDTNLLEYTNRIPDCSGVAIGIERLLTSFS